MSNRFDFEQQLMKCWGILDDIETVEQGLADGSISNENLAVILAGLRALYSNRFEKMFNMFECAIREGRM